MSPLKQLPENTQRELTEEIRLSIIKDLAEDRKACHKWDKAKGCTNLNFYESIDLTIYECLTQLKLLNQLNTEKFDPMQIPGVQHLEKVLRNIKELIQDIIMEKSR